MKSPAEITLDESLVTGKKELADLEAWLRKAKNLRFTAMASAILCTVLAGWSLFDSCYGSMVLGMLAASLNYYYFTKWKTNHRWLIGRHAEYKLLVATLEMAQAECELDRFLTDEVQGHN